MLRFVLICVLGFAWSSTFAAEDVRHVVVYKEDGRFGGWPANHGIWIWENEILVGFSRGYYKDLGNSHHIDRDKPEEYVLARSLDGGLTWKIEKPQPEGALVGTQGMRHGKVPPGSPEEKPVELKAAIDFTHKDFAMTVRMEDANKGTSRFYYSYDRGHHWKGPYALPLFDQPGVMARTDMIVDGAKSCTLFLTAAKSKGGEGRPFCVRTTDGGLTWSFLSYIGPEPAEGYAIMPSSVRLGSTDLLTTTRWRDFSKSGIDAFLSHNNGHSWELASRPEPDAGEGNPPSLTRLVDGRLCLVYGQRSKPFSIRARISKDNGKTWSDPISLRNDGGGRDIGYVRSVLRPDGKLVCVYYYHDQTSPYRFIGATIWDPGKP
jgi:hypothetical protein